MTSVDVASVRVEISKYVDLEYVDVVSPSLTRWGAQIVAVGERGTSREVLGNLDAFVVHADAEEPVVDCDQVSYDLATVAWAVWDGMQPRDEILELTDGCHGDVLLLHQIELEPAARGRDLGLLAVAEFIRVVGRHCSLVVLQAGASGSTSQTMTREQIEAASESLMAHWGRLGLRHVPTPRSEYDDEDEPVKDMHVMMCALDGPDFPAARARVRAELGLVVADG